MVFKKGQSGNPAGKAVGLKDKITKIKEAILTAFDKKAFLKWSKDNNTDFYNLMIKTMPKELQVEDITNYKEMLKDELKNRLEILSKIKSANIEDKKP